MEHFTYFSCERCKVNYRGSRGGTDIRITKTHSISAEHTKTHFRWLLSSTYLPKYLHCLKVSVHHSSKSTRWLLKQCFKQLQFCQVALTIPMLPALTPSTFQTAKLQSNLPATLGWGSYHWMHQNFYHLFCYGDCLMFLDMQYLHRRQCSYSRFPLASLREKIGSISIKCYGKLVINIQLFSWECTTSFSLQWNRIPASTQGSSNSHVTIHLPDTHVY